MKIRTLIVDDESLARERLRQLLQDKPEIEIIGECADGQEAVTALEKDRPDLVFLDIQMPELDGFGVLKAIRDEPMPVIVFVTAHDQFALRAFEVHAVDYLLKPFDRERFGIALNHALEQVKQRGRTGISEKLGDGAIASAIASSSRAASGKSSRVPSLISTPASNASSGPVSRIAR